MAPAVDVKQLDKDVIDIERLQELTLLDDDEDNSFSKGVVHKWVKQGDEVIKRLPMLFGQKKLAEMAKEAHFLKGSSGAVGAMVVYGLCEELKCLGECKDPTTHKPIPEVEARDTIPERLTKTEKAYQDARQQMLRLYPL